MEQLHTFKELLNRIEKKYANPTLLSSYVNNAWETHSAGEFLQQIRYISLALTTFGLKKGDKVGIMAVSSSKWTLADLAIMSIGCVTVPLFASISDENYQYIIAQTKLKTVFIAGQEPWERYHHKKGVFQNAISLENGNDSEGVISYKELLNIGQKLDAENPNLYDQLTSSVKPDDLATIIYTSGSTGVPKGAEHTQYTMNSMLLVDVFHLEWKKDRYLSILPLAHIFARVLNFVMLAWGVSIYYFNDLKNLSIAFRHARPTIMSVVPRVLEKAYAKMAQNVHNASLLKRKIGECAFNLAHEEDHSLKKRLLHPIFDKLVYSHLREALGGKLRIVISGGAALDPHLYHFFLNVGIPVYEGWGLTEGTPISINTIGGIKVGTVGPPVPGMEVKTSLEGELLARGPLIMKGYYNNPEGTAHALDADNWLHTGDKGFVDEDGYVHIIGRIKELFKTSTGEFVAPVPIEHALCKPNFIETAIVIAHKRKFASCLLVPDFDVLKNMKAKKGMPNASDEEFLNSPLMKKEVQGLLNRVNKHLNHWEQIRSYRFILHPLSVEKGELTPSMKIVRYVIEQKYKDLIDSMYEEEENK